MLKQFRAVLATAAVGGAAVAVGLGAAGGSISNAAADSSAKAASVASGCGNLSSLRYVAVTQQSDLDFFRYWRAGLQAAHQEFGVQTALEGPPGQDITGLIAVMDQEIARKPAGMMLLGWDPSLVPEINKAVAAGIPVVTLDTDLATSKRLFFVTTAPQGAGQLAADELARLLHGHGKVGVLEAVTVGIVRDRVTAFLAEMKKYPGIKVVAVANDQGDITPSAQATTAMLQRNPGLNGIFAGDDVAGPGAATAVREAGKVGKVKIIAIDRDPTVLKAIKTGEITETVAQKVQLEPYLAIQVLVGVHCGFLHFANTTARDRALGISAAPSTVDAGIYVINKSNVNDFISPGG